MLEASMLKGIIESLNQKELIKLLKLSLCLTTFSVNQCIVSLKCQ